MNPEVVQQLQRLRDALSAALDRAAQVGSDDATGVAAPEEVPGELVVEVCGFLAGFLAHHLRWLVERPRAAPGAGGDGVFDVELAAEGIVLAAEARGLCERVDRLHRPSGRGEAPRAPRSGR